MIKTKQIRTARWLSVLLVLLILFSLPASVSYAEPDSKDQANHILLYCLTTDTLLYEKLVLALDNFRSTIQARKFCDEYFGGKEVVPLTNLDSDMLDEWNKKYAMKSITAFSIQPISD